MDQSENRLSLRIDELANGNAYISSFLCNIEGGLHELAGKHELTSLQLQHQLDDLSNENIYNQLAQLDRKQKELQDIINNISCETNRSFNDVESFLNREVATKQQLNQMASLINTKSSITATANTAIEIEPPRPKTTTTQITQPTKTDSKPPATQTTLMPKPDPSPKPPTTQDTTVTKAEPPSTKPPIAQNTKTESPSPKPSTTQNNQEISSKLDNLTASITLMQESLSSLRIDLEKVDSHCREAISDFGNRISKGIAKPVEQDPTVLRDRLERQGLKIHKVKGDGSCLFRAISHQLSNNENEHPKLREKACEIMQNDPQILASYADSEDRKKHITNMSNIETWGGHQEIVALAKYLRKNILVYRSSEEYPSVTGAPNEVKDAECVLLAYNGYHYDSIIRIADSQPPKGKLSDHLSQPQIPKPSEVSRPSEVPKAFNPAEKRTERESKTSEAPKPHEQTKKSEGSESIEVSEANEANQIEKDVQNSNPRDSIEEAKRKTVEFLKGEVKRQKAMITLETPTKRVKKNDYESKSNDKENQMVPNPRYKKRQLNDQRSSEQKPEELPQVQQLTPARKTKDPLKRDKPPTPPQLKNDKIGPELKKILESEINKSFPPAQVTKGIPYNQRFVVYYEIQNPNDNPTGSSPKENSETNFTIVQKGISFPPSVGPRRRTRNQSDYCLSLIHI
eukprot:TRINITY_DN4815_c0_g4_i2.p1 TRINITY_DN4815_c0_g4~~TRINITY_DN4815_c0_g4_i2.p1  ORF type:complete len:684 (-),score=53.44 TRINITY_DN4815_c0_g4_i2:63-2114(-)